MPNEDPCHATKVVQSPDDLSEMISAGPAPVGPGCPISPDPTEEFIEQSEAGVEGESTGADEFTNLRVDEVDTGET